MVWTKKSTTALFHPLTEWMATTNVRNIRSSIEMQSNSGACEISAGLQTAIEMDNPDTAIELGSYLTANGKDFGASYADKSTNTDTKLYVRFGVFAKNKLGDTTHSEAAWARLRIDLDPR